VQGAGAYVGKRWADLRTTQREILGEIPDYTIVNLSAGLSNGNWSLELFANNAFDEKGQADRWAQCDAKICGGVNGGNGTGDGVYITPTAPQTIGIKFSQKF